MRHLASVIAILACVAFLPMPTHASSDYGCDAKMKLFHRDFTGCDSMGMLAPGNDTRINLIFLLADLHKQKLVANPPSNEQYRRATTYSPQDWANFADALTPARTTETPQTGTEGEGSVCVSDETGRAGFLSAVAAATDISDPEKRVLSEARKALTCQGAGAAAVQQVQSASAKDFQAYLAATANFYGLNHADPTAFSALTSSNQPWVKEAATYMRARVLLLAAQATAFGDYGTMNREGIDQKAVGTALEALKAYVMAYPAGAYAQSATGLMRRAYWLADDRANQLAAYAQAVTSHEVTPATLELVNELDLKLPVEAYAQSSADVLLKATQVLRSLREEMGNDGKPVPGMTRQELEAQRPQFASQPDVFDYLLATRAWFVDKDAKAVLQILPEKKVTANPGYLEFSRQMLRAAALDSGGDTTVRETYVSLFPLATSAYQRGTLELALALYDERHKNIGAVFGEGTLIQDPTIRKQVLDYVAGPILLRQQATASAASLEERETALFRLLSRDLLHGRFKGFLEDVKLMPSSEDALAQHKADAYPNDPYLIFRWDGKSDGYACPALELVVQKLSANENDIDARLCLGDFFRTASVYDATIDDKDQLGGMGTIFAGKPIARQDIYQDIFRSRAASHKQKAYALYRAVRCYEPTHTNDCGGADVPESTRKAWFNELKKKYADTPWADELRYYW